MSANFLFVVGGLCIVCWERWDGSLWGWATNVIRVCVV